MCEGCRVIGRVRESLEGHEVGLSDSCETQMKGG